MDLFAYIDRTEPSSPTSVATPVSGSAPPFADPSTRSFSQLKELGQTVYKDVWNEFYEWEPEYCVEILGTVTQSILASKRQVARVAKAMVTRLLDDAQERVPGRMPDITDTVGIAVTHFASGGHRGITHRKTTDVSIPIITIDAYPPHPRYESCPPVSRSVLVDVVHEHTLSFLPYADDDRFPAQEYQASFDFLEWETPFDPDGELTFCVCVDASENLLGAVVEMIQIETVRRLHAMRKIDIQDIDRMDMFKEFRLTHNTGLLFEQSQRLVHVPIPKFHSESLMMV